MWLSYCLLGWLWCLLCNSCLTCQVISPLTVCRLPLASCQSPSLLCFELEGRFCKRQVSLLFSVEGTWWMNSVDSRLGSCYMIERSVVRRAWIWLTVVQFVASHRTRSELLTVSSQPLRNVRSTDLDKRVSCIHIFCMLSIEY
jgi:hypothetical protein